jgi:hypothetical protein
MKKLLSLILCIVLVCTTLVGCKQDVIGEFLENYMDKKTQDTAIETLNFYIITGDETSEEAMTTVPQNINAYIKEKYKIELNIHYFTEAEYQQNLMSAMAEKEESKRPDIILISGAAMFDSLKKELVPLNTESFNFYGEDYNKLKGIVKTPLLEASAEDGVYYTVPNNHLIGSYTYVAVDMVMAQDLGYQNKYANDESTLVSNINTVEAVNAFKEKLAAKYPSHNPDHYIQIVENGAYEDFEALKNINLATGTNEKTVMNHVNILSYPVATREEAHLSAFAIVKHLDDDGKYDTEEELAMFKLHYNKCMKIIYALNTDATFKNLLQYGFVGTNYTHVLNEKNEATDFVKLVEDPHYRYVMNHIHTGDSFNTDFYFCENMSWNNTTDPIIWNKDVRSNWLKQIADAVVVVEE